MKTKFRLNAILIAMLSLILIAQQSIAQRTGRDRASFRGNPAIIRPVAPTIYRNQPSYINTRRRIVMNRFNHQPRFMPFGKRSKWPIGLTLGLLPRGYWGFNFGGFPYYYYSGVFYQSTNNRQYQVVEAPIGAEVPNLPNDAKPIIVNEQKLYEYLGTYYKAVMDVNGKRHYIVQGKDGVLNTDNMNEVTVENNNSALNTSKFTPSMGDIVSQLPNQTKVVIINGKKLYVTSENIFYEEFMDENILKYKVVGM